VKSDGFKTQQLAKWKTIEEAKKAGWTPRRWWQWWRWNDTPITDKPETKTVISPSLNYVEFLWKYTYLPEGWNVKEAIKIVWHWKTMRHEFKVVFVEDPQAERWERWGERGGNIPTKK